MNNLIYLGGQSQRNVGLRCDGFENIFFEYSFNWTQCNGMGIRTCGKIIADYTTFSKKTGRIMPSRFNSSNCWECRKIYKKNKETNKHNKRLISDSYIIDILKVGTNLNASDIRKYPQLIEAQRTNLKIKRELKQNN